MDTKAKILYVDDEPINLSLFEINFETQYEVFTALNGFIGLDLLDQEKDIFLIISDMKMPRMNGIEFIKKAKEKHPFKKYYILTGFEITQEIQEALDNKLILKYFRKPFDINEISLVIQDALNSESNKQ